MRVRISERSVDFDAATSDRNTAAVERLLNEREAQGFSRSVTDPAVVGQIAAVLRRSTEVVTPLNPLTAEQAGASL